MMKIAFVVPQVGISGGIGIVLYYANKFAQEGHDVDVINTSGEEFSYWHDIDKVRIISCSDLNRLKFIARARYDCVVGTFWMTIHQIRAGLVNCDKVVYLIQGDEEKFYGSHLEQYREDVRQTYIGSETKVVVSKWLTSTLQARYPSETFHCIENGIDFSKFNTAQPFMEKGNKLRVLVEGPLDSHMKRVRQTIARLKTISNIEIWVVSGSKQSLTGMLVDMFFHSIPHNQMPTIYKSCDVLVKDSQTEGFSLPVAEMMASGGVPITNFFGAQGDLFQDGRTGFCTETITRNYLYDTLAYISSRHESISRKIVREAERFDWKDQHLQFINIIDQTKNNSNANFKNNYMETSHNPVPKSWIIQDNKLPDVFVSLSHVSGWASLADGSEPKSLSILYKDNEYNLKPGIHRADVCDHLGKDGFYGFKVNVFIPENAEITIIYSSPDMANAPVRYTLNARIGSNRVDGLVLYIEKLGQESLQKEIDLSTVPHLKEGSIRMKCNNNITINGIEEKTEALFKKDSVISVKSDKIDKLIAKFLRE